MWGVKREKRGSQSSCMAEAKAAEEGIKGMQCLRHPMRQLGLPDADCPAPAQNDNGETVDWIDSGCKPTKKLRHENFAELGMAKAKQHREVSVCWIPGKTNPADVFTKEDHDAQHYCSLRDLMVVSRESFGDSHQTDKINETERADQSNSDKENSPIKHIKSKRLT